MRLVFLVSAPRDVVESDGPEECGFREVVAEAECRGCSKKAKRVEVPVQSILRVILFDELSEEDLQLIVKW